MQTATILAVGDISLLSPVNQNPFLNIKEILNNKDLLIGNLETPLTSQTVQTEKATSLAVSSDKVSWLKSAGFDMLSIANNHILDAGPDGFIETLNTLHNTNILYDGGISSQVKHHACSLTVNDISVRMLAYYEYGHADSTNKITINCVDEDAIIADIKSAQTDHDHVLLSLHWGIENVAYPSPRQIQLARTFIDSGATAVIGHHPHVMQGVERYKNGLIAYSTGNFQFPGSFNNNRPTSYRPDLSFVLKLTLSKTSMSEYNLIPIKITNRLEPTLCSEPEKNEILAYINKISNPITSDNITSSFWYAHIASSYLQNNNASFLRRIKLYGISHLFAYLKWLVSPFVIKCYWGLLLKLFKNNHSVTQPKVDRA